MIKAKVVSFTLSRPVSSIPKLDIETYLEDLDDLNSFAGADFDGNGLDMVIMTEEEYKALDSVSDVLRKSLLDEREKTRKLQEENEKLCEENDEVIETIQKLQEENAEIQKDIEDLEEKMAQDAAEVDIHPDGAIVFKKKRVSELEKEVEKLKEENKYLKRRLLTRYTVKLDADGAIIYPELKED